MKCQMEQGFPSKVKSWGLHAATQGEHLVPLHRQIQFCLENSQQTFENNIFLQIIK